MYTGQKNSNNSSSKCRNIVKKCWGLVNVEPGRLAVVSPEDKLGKHSNASNNDWWLVIATHFFYFSKHLSAHLSVNIFYLAFKSKVA